MATTRKHIAAAPERVVAVLAEPGNYADWVVGSDTIRDADPPRRLVLHARPLGTAVVTIELEPREGGTEVTMTETAGDPLSRLGINRLTDPLVHTRNVKSLQRLKRFAETGVVKA